MKRAAWALAAAAVAAAMSTAQQAAPAGEEQPANTAEVQRGGLSAMVSLNGILTHRARPDGSPYAVVNQASGTYTKLPTEGAKVDCGDVLYRVDDEPVVLLCGAVPAYRDLGIGDTGNDVRQLNRHLGLESNEFTWRTAQALGRAELDRADAVFLPRPVRIATVTAELGGPARPGARIAQATSGVLEVHVALDASQQGEVKQGDRARITLPGNRSVTGRVQRLGKVARTAGKEDEVGNATIPAYISLRDQQEARGFDRAPVRVEVTTEGVANVLSVPVVALVGKSGAGFAVEVVRAGGRRELVAVRLGLFDTAGGRVQVDGRLREGDRVVVPSP